MSEDQSRAAYEAWKATQKPFDASLERERTIRQESEAETPTCAACGERIEGTVANLLGEKMHPECAEEIHQEMADYDGRVRDEFQEWENRSGGPR